MKPAGASVEAEVEAESDIDSISDHDDRRFFLDGGDLEI